MRTTREPTHGQAFQVLLLQAADEGRAEALFGDSLERAREAAGEPECADLYPSLAERMPQGWPLSFFGMFRDGPGAAVVRLLENWGAADGRWRQAVQSAFARALPVERESSGTGRYAFALMPQWAKARWTGGALQPAKLYHLAHAGPLG